jgi:hypothetical protein
MSEHLLANIVDLRFFYPNCLKFPNFTIHSLLLPNSSFLGILQFRKTFFLTSRKTRTHIPFIQIAHYSKAHLNPRGRRSLTPNFIYSLQIPYSSCKQPAFFGYRNKFREMTNGEMDLNLSKFAARF